MKKPKHIESSLDTRENRSDRVAISISNVLGSLPRCSCLHH